MNNFIILSQGIKPIVISFILAVLTSSFISDTLGNLLLVVTLFIMFIFRNTKREIKRDGTEILSIIDGTVDAIDKSIETTKVYINVSILDSHILRAPIDAQMISQNHINGLNLNPNSFKATKLNESLDLNFDNINVNLLSGICNNKLDIHSSNVVKGDEIGLFLNGVVTLTFKNKDIKLNINLGDKVKAGQTVIAFKNQG
ncbi:MAG: hypothetical protein HOF69_06890 [Campylobacteraceae bacterium]|jgi:phosphatidylserine decarboxylase|nr:hypothetical protein [Campylobacteraceae bacterium]MBT3882967.1 hypothetical protein [Campylobacteraceae bacterium]MBT4030961.1 hypothetical protein [Campylobacteraceae bacterium]MBT4179593.1 hypothetical protein [Campylobacteraceae bacterium]MBT4707827.1 hypothetical protein [Campylobacteraceae bacterium]